MIDLGNIFDLPEVKTQVGIDEETKTTLYILAGFLIAGAIVTAAIATKK